MQGGSPSIKIASPWSRKVDFSVVGKISEEGRKKCLKCWKIECYRLVVSFFLRTFVVQRKRERTSNLCNGNERKSPALVSQRTTGLPFFLKSLQRYENYSDQPNDIRNDVCSSSQLGRVHYHPMQQHRQYR